MVKQAREDSWLLLMNGYSTSGLASPVRMKRLATQVLNRRWTAVVLCFHLLKSGLRNRTNTEAARTSTPSLLECRMVYMNSKYYSGLLCRVVARELAGVKFSASTCKL